LIKRFDAENVFWYFDPPYIVEGGELYTGDTFNHVEFCDQLSSIEGLFCVSYTDIPKELERYTVVERERAQHMRKGQSDMKKQTRTERLVMNYNPKQTPLFKEQEQTGLAQYD